MKKRNWYHCGCLTKNIPRYLKKMSWKHGCVIVNQDGSIEVIEYE